MSTYTIRQSGKKNKKLLVFTVILALVVALCGATYFVRQHYFESLRPVSSSTEVKSTVIPSGATAEEIGAILKKNGLIRSEWAFQLYVHTKNARDSMKAGTYALSPNLSVSEIVAILSHGKVETDLVTILPGQRIDQVRQALIDEGYDTTAVDAALNPATYRDEPVLVDKPANASLEGYLYPESFQKTAETEPEVIIRQSLNEMHEHLTPQLREAFAKQGLSVYEAITLASIVENEVPNSDERAQVAQVFYKRLRSDMKLESDATAAYGAVLAGQPPSRTYNSVYNTYAHKGLPPTPISNVTISSLRAVAYPADTDWLFFVSGDDGRTHFSKTLAEHEALTKQYCTTLCQ